MGAKWVLKMIAKTEILNLNFRSVCSGELVQIQCIDPSAVIVQVLRRALRAVGAIASDIPRRFLKVEKPCRMEKPRENRGKATETTSGFRNFTH